MDTQAAIAAIALVAGSAALSSWATWHGLRVNRVWYEKVKDPLLTPPPIVFSVAWTLLYIVLAFLLWRALRTGNGPGTVLLVTILALNVAWCVAFFLQRQPWAALVILVAIQATAVVAAVHVFSSPVERAGMALFVVWIGFATALNAVASLRNR